MKGSRSKRVALLGIFAIFFQAIMFGWHHHDLVFAEGGAALALSAPTSGSTNSPAADADECEICIALHHQAAAPMAFMVAAVPGLAAAPRTQEDRAFFVLADYRAFDSRAPPRA
jgi:hypothetical protein